MKPSVHFSCLACGWRHDVPDEHVQVVGGLPRSSYVPLHICEDGADVEERGAFDANLYCETPGYNIKITL